MIIFICKLTINNGEKYEAFAAALRHYFLRDTVSRSNIQTIK